MEEAIFPPGGGEGTEEGTSEQWFHRCAGSGEGWEGAQAKSIAPGAEHHSTALAGGGK